MEISDRAQALARELQVLGISEGASERWAAQAEGGVVVPGEKKNELPLYGPIAPKSDAMARMEKEFGISSFSAASVRARLEDMTGDLTIPIYSPGGVMPEMEAIRNTLMAYKKEKDANLTFRADGFVGSAAAFLFMAGDERLVSKMSFLMFHEVRLSALNMTEARMEGLLDALRKYNRVAFDYAAERSGMSVKDLREKTAGRDWEVDSAEALKVGLATGLYEEKKKDEVRAEASAETLAQADLDIRATLDHPAVLTAEDYFPV